MSSTQVPIIRKSDFALQVTASGSSDAILAPLVDIIGFVSAVALVRVYSSSAYPSAATLKLIVYNAMNGPDDPNTVLIPSGTGMVEITNAQNTTNLLQLAAFTLPIGRYARVLLRATSGGNAGTLTATLAVDLVGRDA